MAGAAPLHEQFRCPGTYRTSLALVTHPSKEDNHADAKWDHKGPKHCHGFPCPRLGFFGLYPSGRVLLLLVLFILGGRRVKPDKFNLATYTPCGMRYASLTPTCSIKDFPLQPNADRA
jgi:hypothetical protein